jgi:hypothetical protein
MNGLSKGSSIIPVTGVDLTGKEGYLVKNNAGVHAINDSATVPALGVVLEANTAAKQSSVGILSSLPPVRMVAGGAIALYDEVQQKNDGTVLTDAGAGARVIVGRALEAAAAGDQFLVQPYSPQIRS